MSILFPDNIYCISCDDPISIHNKLSLCKKCYYEIEFLDERNINCDQEVMKLLEKNYIKEIHISTVYKSVMKHLIYKIKYFEKTYLATYFAQMIFDTIQRKNIEFDYISYVPIHKKRYMQRGYNQVELIAKKLEKMTDKKMIHIAKRVKNTKSLFGLSLDDRENEMKNAFECEHIEMLSNKSVLILDDILTTGSTMKNLCECIHKNNKNTQIKLMFLSRASIK